jgi:hypothetical protein
MRKNLVLDFKETLVGKSLASLSHFPEAIPAPGIREVHRQRLECQAVTYLATWLDLGKCGQDVAVNGRQAPRVIGDLGKGRHRYSFSSIHAKKLLAFEPFFICIIGSSRSGRKDYEVPVQNGSATRFGDSPLVLPCSLME